MIYTIFENGNLLITRKAVVHVEIQDALLIIPPVLHDQVIWLTELIHKSATNRNSFDDSNPLRYCFVRIFVVFYRVSAVIIRSCLRIMLDKMWEMFKNATNLYL